MAIIKSTWADKKIAVGGVLGSAEWSGSGKAPIPAGYLMVKNDAEFLYLALDMVGDKGKDPGTGDYFWFSVDVDNNKQITPRRDVNYGLWPGKPNNLARQYYLGPGRWTGILNEESSSKTHIGFGASPNSSTAHRVWELQLDLTEIGVDLSASDSPPVVCFGLRVKSSTPNFTYDYPSNFYRNFANLNEIILARQPEANYPPGTAGILIGGVGLIPASAITGGYATTDPSYYLPVKDAAFGGKMHLIGNRTTLQTLWSQSARFYRILHRAGGSGAFAPIRQSWSNYRWNGTKYVLENFGPDAADKYPMLNPSEDYSIDDLLLQWQSSGFAAGIHEFRAEFFRANGTPVPAPAQTLALMLDNNLPEVSIDDILHNNASVPPCAILNLGNNDGVRLKITVNDAEGHLLNYKLAAHYGDGAKTTIASDNYNNYVSASRKWEGVKEQLVPPGEWVPPVTCAYQFRLSAHPRVINGYTHIGYIEDTRHVTLVKPGVSKIISPKISTNLAFGFTAFNKPDSDGEEPSRLGGETI